MNPQISEATFYLFMEIVLAVKSDKYIRVKNSKDVALYTILVAQGFIDICVHSKQNYFVYDVTSLGYEMLKKFRNQMNSITSPTNNEVKFYFAKRCKKCNSIYYKKELSKPAYENLVENKAITSTYDNESWCGVIESCCETCSG